MFKLFYLYLLLKKERASVYRLISRCRFGTFDLHR